LNIRAKPRFIYEPMKLIKFPKFKIGDTPYFFDGKSNYYIITITGRSLDAENNYIYEGENKEVTIRNIKEQYIDNSISKLMTNFNKMRSVHR